MNKSSLFFRGLRELSAPDPNVARVPDVETGLYADWNVQDIIDEKTTVASWADNVSGRTLMPIVGLSSPSINMSSLNGRGAMSFDYPKQDVVNASELRGLVANPGFNLQPGTTLAGVFFTRSKLELGANPRSRLFASNTSTNYYAVGNQSNTQAGMGMLWGNPAVDGPQRTGAEFDMTWRVVVAVFGASSTQLYIDDLPPVSGPGVGSVVSNGFRVGVNAANAISSAFTGYLRAIRIYNRALSATDARGLISYLRWNHLMN